MADFIFKISPNVILGSYATSRLGQFAKEIGMRFMIITDPVLAEFGTTKKITSALEERNIDFFIYDEVPSAPDSSVIERVLSLAKDAHIHGIISVGGSRISNVARAVSALFYEVHSVYDFLEGATPTTSPLPLIIVPTALCDPFIFSDKTPIIDGRSRHLKMLRTSQGICRLAVFDPSLTVSFTDSQQVSMMLHALCIALEAYTSQRANFFSDGLIEKALSLLSSIIYDKYETLTVPREEIFVQAASLISLAAACSSIGIASGINLSINARYKISRSLVSAIMLPHMIEEIQSYKTERLVKMADLLQIDKKATTNDEKVQALVEYVRNKIALQNLPARFKDLDVTMEQLGIVAENTAELAGTFSYSRSMTSDDIFDIIKNAY